MANYFYRNPRLLVLTIGLIVVSGLSSYYVLPRMEDPLLTQRAAKITTVFPGADATRVESLVTERLEEELREIEEIKELRSTSRAGVSTVLIELRDDVYQVEGVWSRVRNKMDDAAAKMPSGAKKPEFDDIRVRAYALIVALAWSEGGGEPNYAILRRLAERLEDELLGLAGTEQIDTFGDPREEIVVEIDPSRATQLGLTAMAVADQLKASDAKVAAGSMRADQGDFLLEVDAELDSMARIGHTPVQLAEDGRFVPLADIAAIRKGIAEPPDSLSLIGGQPAVTLGVLTRPADRVDRWSAAAEQVLRDFGEQLPSGVRLVKVFEQNTYVNARFATLLQNLGLGAVAVALVVLVLMGWRSAFVVAMTLPLSALIVLTGLRWLDIPIHQMSVTGLIIALGLLIDNAIVTVDEVSEQLREGRSPAEAVSGTVRRLAVPLLGSTITTALAFAPIAIMPGPAGEFVGSIAVSVILAILSSLFLAMTVVPAATAFLDRQAGSVENGWPRRGVTIPWLMRWYRRSLDFVFARPLVGVSLGFALPLLGFFQARHLAEQFFPPADRNQFQLELELPASASLGQTLARAEAVRERILSDPAVDRVDWFLGESAPTFYYNLLPRNAQVSRYAQGLVTLESADDLRDVIRRLQDQLDREFPDARVLARQLEQGPPFAAPIEVRLFGPDLERLRELGDELRLHLSEVPEVIHTKAELSEPAAKLMVVVDEEDARLAGLNHTSIARQLDANLEGVVGGSVLEATEELPVRVRIPGARRGNRSAIAALDLLSGPSAAGDGNSLPLSALAELKLVPEISVLPRFNGRRMNEVQGFVTAGVLPSEVLSRLQNRLDQDGFRLPPGYSMEYGGESAKRNDAVGNLMASVGVLAVLVVATLVLSLGSFRMAAIIGAVAALSSGLSLGALWLFGYPFGFMAIVGTMGLMGVAINDAIVVLTAIRGDSRARQGDPQAVVDVVLRSTRHVIATTLTTMVGFLPLLLGGGGFWPPLAVAIAGGVGGATLLGLYFGPAAYTLIMCRGRNTDPTCESGAPACQSAGMESKAVELVSA
jgi:multidrug efflux pump subunit AcrB